jgi:hypothetical protein
MLAYWLLFGFFAAGSAVSAPRHLGDQRRTQAFLALGALIITIAVGMRYHVGGDWTQYQYIFVRTTRLEFFDALSKGDPGYQLVNWLVGRMGLQVWAVNTVCAAIFASGLYRFARTQPDPWLVILIAVPYLIVVVAMGYTRQAAALGMLLHGITSMLRTRSVLRFLCYAAAAGLFHKTAILAVPLVTLSGGSQNRWSSIFLTLVGLAGLYYSFLNESADLLVRNYIKSDYSSQGAMIRVTMCVLPALIFLLFKDRLQFDELEERIWRNFTVASLASLAALFVLPSTVVDRLALYIIPLQLAVMGRLPNTLFSLSLGRSLVILLSFFVQFVWLNFAAHAGAWIPYRFFPV